MSSMVPRSVPYNCLVQPPSKTCMAPFRTPIQNPHTGAPSKRELLVIEKQARYQNDWHDEMSSMVPRSALPHSEPPFKIPHTGAPFKRELSVIGKQARYQNDWHDEMSSMVPRSAPYDCPIWPRFKPLMAPFRTPIQNPRTEAPFKREPLVIGKRARHQSNQDINTSSMVSRSALYDCPVWPPFMSLRAPFKIPIQDPHSKPHSKSPFRIPFQRR